LTGVAKNGIKVARSPVDGWGASVKQAAGKVFFRLFIIPPGVPNRGS
jgi:hypothetical protein